MTVRLLLQYVDEASHALVFAEPWIRLLIEVESPHSAGHAIRCRKEKEPTLRLQKHTNSYSVIDSIELEHVNCKRSRAVQRYLTACSWWLCRAPFSAHTLAVNLAIRGAYAPLLFPTVFDITHLQISCAERPPCWHHRVSVRGLHVAFPKLQSIEVSGTVIEDNHSDHFTWTTLRSVSLSADNCEAILPHLAVDGIVTLHVNAHCALKHFPPLRSGAQLRELHLFRIRPGVIDLFAPKNVRAPLPALTRLTLADCVFLDDLTPLASLTELRYLCLRGNSMRCLRPLACCTQLVTLDVGDCPRVHDLSPLACAPLLESLDISRTNVASLSVLLACRHLTSLHVNLCRNLVSLSALANSPSLSNLSASMAAVDNVDGLCKCLFLRVLCLDTTDVAALTGLASCPHLETLGVRACTALQALSDLAGAPSLHTVDASNSGVACLRGLSRCPALYRLVLRNCEGLHQVGELAGSPSLEFLDVSGAGVTSLEGLAACPRLASLTARDCMLLRSLAGVGGAPSLKELDASTSTVCDIGVSLAACSAVFSLRLRNCHLLMDLTTLAGAHSLRVLDTAGTSVPRECQVLDLLPSLELLFVSEAPPERPQELQAQFNDGTSHHCQCVSF